MSLHVGMDCKCCIHPPFQNTSSVGTEDHWHRSRASEIAISSGEQVCSNHPCRVLALLSLRMQWQCKYWVWLVWWHIVSWPPGCETLQPFQVETSRRLRQPWRDHREKHLTLYHLPWVLLYQNIDDLVDVVEHWYVHLAMNSVVQSHSEILVNSASTTDCHLSWPVLKDTFVFLPEPLNHVIVSSAAMVTQFAVIYMKPYCHLHAIDSLVCYAWIVWIDFESDTRQTLGEFAIVQ
jgi:hypothetical protein